MAEEITPQAAACEPAIKEINFEAFPWEGRE